MVQFPFWGRWIGVIQHILEFVGKIILNDEVIKRTKLYNFQFRLVWCNFCFWVIGLIGVVQHILVFVGKIMLNDAVKRTELRKLQFSN